MSSLLVCQRHAAFIAKRLAITFGVFAIAPFFLAYCGAPTGAETLVFACSFAPLAAAVLAARTGWLTAAHAVAFIGLVALSLSLWLGLGCGADCAIAWLITAQIEAMLAGDKRLSLSAGMVTGVIVLAILAGSSEDPSDSTATVTAAFAALALAYAIVVITGSWRRADSRQGDGSRDQDAGLHDGVTEGAATPSAEPRPVQPPIEASDGDRCGPDARDPNSCNSDTCNPDAWRTISELLDEHIVEFDRSGSVVRVATGEATRLGVRGADLMARGLFDRIHIADRPTFLKHIADAAHDGARTVTTIRLRTSDADATSHPTYTFVDFRVARRVSPARPSPAEVVATLRQVDIAQAPLEADTTAHPIEDVVGARDHFLANMSHELRAPLNAIIGFSEMLASRTTCPADADRQREYAQIIHQSGQHLLSMVTAILDTSKIESGMFPLVPEPFEIAPLMDLCCDMVALKAEAGGMALVRDYPDRLDTIIGDARAYKQVLINLLSNAIKFTPQHGQIIVSARRDETALVLSVSDTGIGIGAHDLARIGAPFFQAQSTPQLSCEGTGLGLSVVRGLVGLHGGTIALESELGRGTRISVRWPLDCRSAGTKGTSATIETIVGCQVPPTLVSRNDQGMKKIA